MVFFKTEPLTNVENTSGWQCPRCGSIYSPYIQECISCNMKCSTLKTVECNHVYGPYIESTSKVVFCKKCGEPEPVHSWNR